MAGRNNRSAILAERHAADFAADSDGRHAADFVAGLGEGQDFLAWHVPPQRGTIPDADGPVGAGRRETPTVRAERHAGAAFGMSARAEDLPAALRLPDTHRLVFAARSQQPPVRAEGYAFDVSGMQVERAEDLAAGRIRQFHRPVKAGRR